MLTPVVHLVIACINRALEKLINLLLAHLLAQICQDVLDLALADETRPVLVEDLEAADVFFDVEGFAEAAGAVEDLGEGLEIDCLHMSAYGPCCVDLMAGIVGWKRGLLVMRA